MDLKVCTQCKKEKPRTDFHKSTRNKDGMQSHCKACKKQYYQENREQFSKYKKQYYQENREQLSELNKQWYQKNREQLLEYRKQYYQENREQLSEYGKKYYQKNRERVLDRQKQYYQENRERVLDRKKQWRRQTDYYNHYRQENPEKIAAKRAKRRSLKQGAVPYVLRDCPVEKERLVQIYKLRDTLTKVTGIEYHVDHIWPLSKGGSHWSGNLQIITAEENLSKGDSLCEETARVIQESLDEYCSS